MRTGSRIDGARSEKCLMSLDRCHGKRDKRLTFTQTRITDMTYTQRTAAIRAKYAKVRARREFARRGGVFGAVCRFLFEAGV